MSYIPSKKGSFMKKNNDKNRRIKFFDWFRKKTPEPPEKLFTRSPYRTMFKTAYERNFLGQGQRPYSCILETKESVLSIHFETGELTEKTRSIVQEFYASESYDDPISPYEVTHSERAVSCDELPALVEASKDKAAERYRGMTAYNWRDYFDETKGNQGTGCGSNGNSVITGM